jgi:hypothetical protein
MNIHREDGITTKCQIKSNAAHNVTRRFGHVTDEGLTRGTSLVTNAEASPEGQLFGSLV